ncbi:MAG: hypothetical protein LBP81_03980 [Treponema sp.]|jgi:hypothetical protein|nr:hypothetical protein [Treponema sp.]
MKGFGETFPFQPEGVLVFFETPVDSRGTDGCEFFSDAGGTVEGRPAGDIGHLLPHEGARICGNFVSAAGLIGGH